MIDLRTHLERLAGLYGVELSFFDVRGERYDASDDALLAVLTGLGAEVLRPEDLPAAISAKERALAERVLEPVSVVWGNAVATVRMRLLGPRPSGPFAAHVKLESGETFRVEGRLDPLPVVGGTQIDDTRWSDVAAPLGRALPFGYHEVELELGGYTYSQMIISAPVRAYAAPEPRQWGFFVPTYALRTDKDLGVGDLGSLEAFFDWARTFGARYVGTLPLMSAFLDQPFEPSPYAPVSRLFWNELFLDLERLPELAASPAAQLRLRSPELRAEAEVLRAAPQVDYRRAMALKRSVLEPLAASVSPADVDRLVAADPQLGDYARFRAATRAQAKGWPVWPQRMRDGDLREGDFDPAEMRYHVCVQAGMRAQMAAFGDRASAQGGGLYLDMPLGVHPDGYDAWRERDAFLPGCSAGAPPDDLFVGGQDWGFRPLHPEQIRTRRYRYVIDSIRHQLAIAGALRIDHVMGLYRIYCVPMGLGARQGVYVRFRAEELYAILTLESHRHSTMIVGEDLGTVPDDVREAMTRHDFSRMYVGQFEMRSDPKAAVVPAPEAAVASLNTHDTPTFAAFWEGGDIDDRLALGHLAKEAEAGERHGREALRAAVTEFLRGRGLLGANETGTASVLAAMLRGLASGEARVLLVSLEDLWLEHRPQNVPGTVDEHPNWRRKATRSLAELDGLPGLTRLLRDLETRRRR